MRRAYRARSNISGVGPVSYTHLDVYKRQDAMKRMNEIKAMIAEHSTQTVSVEG